MLLDLPYHKLEHVLVFGAIQITTQAMAELLEKGVHLSLFSSQGSYRGSLSSPRGKNVELHYKEYIGSIPWRGYSEFVVDSIVAISDPAK